MECIMKINVDDCYCDNKIIFIFNKKSIKYHGKYSDKRLDTNYIDKNIGNRSHLL